MVMQRHRDLYHSLQKRPLRRRRVAPHVFQDFVGVKESAPVEKFKTVPVAGIIHAAIVADGRSERIPYFIASGASLLKFHIPACGKVA
jgi:hypothetical protein